MTITLAGGLALGAAACSDDGDSAGGTDTECGPGTVLQDGVCVGPDAGPTVTCGAGTVLQDGKCVASDAGTAVTCGPGTVLQDGVCVAGATDAGSAVTCGPDTVLQGDKCVSQLFANGWDNLLALKLGVTLLKDYPDSGSGPEAWSASAHPLVYITSMGPGYGGILSGDGGGQKWPGAAIIDANDRTVVTSANFDMTAEGWTDVFEPHGLGVSPDGKYIYIPTGDGSAKGRLLIVNTKTLKLDKVLGTKGRPHHVLGFTDSTGKDLVLAYGWGQPPFVMDPADGNRIVGGANYDDTGIEGYLYAVTPDGKEMWGSGRWRNGGWVTGPDKANPIVHGQVFYSVDTTTWKLKTYMTYPDETTPIWIDFSPDNKYAFVTGGHSSTVLRYDRTQDLKWNQLNPVIVDTGVLGPYGNKADWTGAFIYAVEKHEGGDNKGTGLGIIDTTQLKTPGYKGLRIETACLRGDHGLLHPTSAKNEIWVSCNSSFETIVFDMTSKTVAKRIPQPNGASTHSGAFVAYDANFAGKLLSDLNGLHGTALAEQKSKWAMP